MLGHAKIRPQFNFCSVVTKRPIYVGRCHVHKLSLLWHGVIDEIEIRQQWRRADRFANLLTRSVVKNMYGGTIPCKKREEKKWSNRWSFSIALTQSFVCLYFLYPGSGFHHHLSLPEFFSSRVFDRSQVLDFTVLLDLRIWKILILKCVYVLKWIFCNNLLINSEKN
jgi:hypothetical protein